MNNGDTYFGRNLDLDYDLGQSLVVTPRNYPFKFKKLKTLNNHYAMVGIASVIDGYPLYFDATNEYGLSIAGLRFREEVKSSKTKPNKINLAQFEFIPYILGTCRNVKEALEVINKVVLLNLDFSKKIKSSKLHYMIADKKECYVIESLSNGLNVYKNPYGVLTNSPPFPYHLENVRLFLNLTNELVESKNYDSLKLTSFTSGQGTYGLPGDVTSPSRFVKAVFLKTHSKSRRDEGSNVNQFLRILDNVSFVRGEAISEANLLITTIYSTCVNLNKLIFYYKTYNNPLYYSLELKKLNLDTKDLYQYSLNDEAVITNII
jgi:choloylglycine hydrolase